MRLLLLIAPLALCACTELVPLMAPPVMDNAECRAEAVRSREARNIRREFNFENQANVRRVQTEEREAEARIYDACLRRLGLPSPGGVEPVLRTF